MDENLFRKKFVRLEKKTLGVNTNVVNRIIYFINSTKNKCKNETVKLFLDNLDKIDATYKLFNIEDLNGTNGIKVGFSYLWQKLLLKEDLSDIAMGHELGHVLNGVKNITFADPIKHPLESLKTNIIIPEGFDKVIENAKENCISSENKEEFKKYIEHICKGDTRTEAERVLVSDILSAVFGVQGLRIGTYENLCMFPGIHREFFDKNLSISKRNEVKFDECFADIFSLIANNCEKELNDLNRFLGKDFIQWFVSEIEKAIQSFRSDIEHSLLEDSMTAQTSESISKDSYGD